MPATATRRKRRPDRRTLAKRHALVASCAALVHHVVHELARLPQWSGLCRRIGHEELAAVGTVGLVEAAAKYDGRRRARFSSYAFLGIRFALLTFLTRQYSRWDRVRSFTDDEAQWFTAREPCREAVEAAETVRAGLDRLREEDRCVLERRLDGAALREIARERGLTIQRIGQISQRAEQTLRRELERMR